MADYKGGRKWQNSNELTGVNGMATLNSSEKQGIVSSDDSLGLFIEVSEISYIDDAGSLMQYPGTPSPVTVPGNEATVFIYIDDSNLLQQSISSFPAMGNFFIALGIVTTSVTNVLQIINMQQASATVAAGGVNSLAVTSPVLNTGTATDPVIDMQPATAGQDGHATIAQISKLDGIELLADVTDAANVDAAGAVMESDITANGNLITKVAGVITEIVPGLAGTILTSAGPGNAPAFMGSTGFNPQVLVAHSTAAVVGSGLAPNLPYASFSWAKVFNRGAIDVDGVTPTKINVPVAGAYIAFLMTQFSGNNPAGTWTINYPADPKIGIGQQFQNFGAGSYSADMNIIAGFETEGGDDLAIETTQSFGKSGTAIQHILIILKVAN